MPQTSTRGNSLSQSNIHASSHGFIHKKSTGLFVSMSSISSFTFFKNLLSGLEKGQSIVVSEEEGGNVSKCFYTNEYIDTIGKPAEVSDATMSLPLDFVRGRITAPILKTFRERLLCTLWKVYLHPSMRWSHVLFTYKVRRAVKRLLSKRPMHEIVRR